MTETTSTADLVQSFIAALSPIARRAIVDHIGIDHDLVILVSKANREHEWSGPELAAHCNHELAGKANARALIIDRIEHAAYGVAHRPKPPLPNRFTQPIPWCGQCSDPHARWVEDPDNGRPLGRCPKCWTPPPVKGTP